MILNIQSRTLLLIIRSLFCGCALGLLYDLTHTRPRGLASPPRKSALFFRGAILFFLDVIFCIVSAVAAELMTYYFGGGFFRAIVYVMVALGFLGFRYTVGILLRRLLSYLYGCMLRVTVRLVRLLRRPLVFACRKIKCLYRLTIGRFLGKIKAGYKARRTPEPAKHTEEGEMVYVANGYGYKKHGRINLHGQRRGE